MIEAFLSVFLAVLYGLGGVMVIFVAFVLMIPVYAIGRKFFGFDENENLSLAKRVLCVLVGAVIILTPFAVLYGLGKLMMWIGEAVYYVG